jgi:hypothetical protein
LVIIVREGQLRLSHVPQGTLQEDLELDQLQIALNVKKVIIVPIQSLAHYVQQVHIVHYNLQLLRLLLQLGNFHYQDILMQYHVNLAHFRQLQDKEHALLVLLVLNALITV